MPPAVPSVRFMRNSSVEERTAPAADGHGRGCGMRRRRGGAERGGRARGQRRADWGRGNCDEGGLVLLAQPHLQVLRGARRVGRGAARGRRVAQAGSGGLRQVGTRGCAAQRPRACPGTRYPAATDSGTCSVSANSPCAGGRFAQRPASRRGRWRPRRTRLRRRVVGQNLSLRPLQRLRGGGPNGQRPPVRGGGSWRRVEAAGSLGGGAVPAVCCGPSAPRLRRKKRDRVSTH